MIYLGVKIRYRRKRASTVLTMAAILVLERTIPSVRLKTSKYRASAVGKRSKTEAFFSFARPTSCLVYFSGRFLRRLNLPLSFFFARNRPVIVLGTMKSSIIVSKGSRNRGLQACNETNLRRIVNSLFLFIPQCPERGGKEIPLIRLRRPFYWILWTVPGQYRIWFLPHFPRLL